MRKARARWIARRTLHRGIGAAKGETQGVPTYEVEGAEVALPPGAHHFRRVVACARCGQAVLDRSRPVYRRRDLHAEIAIMCDECAQLPVLPTNGDPTVAQEPDAQEPSAP